MYELTAVASWRAGWWCSHNAGW